MWDQSRAERDCHISCVRRGIRWQQQQLSDVLLQPAVLLHSLSGYLRYRKWSSPLHHTSLRNVIIMTFWYGSGSLPLTNGSGSGSRFFVSDLQQYFLNLSKQIIFFLIFFAYYFSKVHLHRSSKIKGIKKSQNSRNKGCSYYFYFLLMMEGSGSEAWSVS